jgi:hypothetical protein
MNADIKDAGRAVTCRLQANNIRQAHMAHAFADENPPAGYMLLRSSIARRKKGGRARFIKLNYIHTGGPMHPPISKWQQWNATLRAEQELARGD